MCPTTPAIISAIHDATGIWFHELAVTLERMPKALEESTRRARKELIAESGKLTAHSDVGGRNKVFSKRRPAILLIVAVALTMGLVVACGTSSPAPSSSPSVSASPKSSAPASTAASPSSSAASPSSNASAADQAYQKAQEEWKQVMAAAEKEPQPAVIYSVLTPEFNQMYQTEFNKINPKVQVSISRLISAAATERLKAEQATKQYVGNAYIGNARRMAKDGLGQTTDLLVLHDPSVKWTIDPLMDKPLETIVNSFNKYVIAYNTNLVPTGQEPKTWADLADPKWKDQLALWDPHNPGIGQSLLTLLYLAPSHGPDLMRKVLQNVKVAADSGEAARLVARGDVKLAVITWGDYYSVKDGPVKLSAPQDGTAGNTTYSLMIKNAPQPNTTRLFLNYVLDKPGQAIMGKGYGIIRADVQAEVKDGQILPGEKFLANVPYGADFELTKMQDPPKLIVQWLNEMGK